MSASNDTPCLSDAALAALAQGLPASPAADAHLATCERCAEALLGHVRTTLTPTRPPAPPGPGPAPLEGTALAAEPAGRYAPVLDDAGAEVELGRGGIGRVLLMEDRQLGRQVAMKLLLPGRIGEVGSVEAAAIAARFLREARVTGQLEHPGIVPVHELGLRDDGSLYYTMRRVRGRTLARAIAEAPSLDARLALLPHVLAASQALAFAHAHRVVHRDVKPQNVMVDRFGETYLVDWGLARARGAGEIAGPPVTVAPPDTAALRLTPGLTDHRANVVLGTPAYMAPEQLAGRIGEVDERSDVWALGAILYEVLSGHMPRQLDPRASGGLAFLPVVPVATRAPGVPRELAAICERALSEDRAARYATAAEFAADLDAWMHGRRVGAYEYRPWDLLVRFVARYRAAVAVAALALVGLAALGARSVQRVQAERNDARELAGLLLVDVSKTLEPVPGSLPVLDALTRRALGFYARIGRDEGLDPGERAQMANAVARLSQLNLKLGRLEESHQLAGSCDVIVGPPEGAARGGPALLAESVGCAIAAGSVRLLEGRGAEARAHFAEAKRRVALAPGPDAWDEPRWLQVRSVLASRLFRLAYDEGAMEEAHAFAREQVALDERVLAKTPGDVGATRALARSLSDLQLLADASGETDEALALGARAVVLLQSLPEASHDANVTLALGGIVSQQQLLLLQAGRREEAAALLVVGRRAFERLLTLEPDSMMALGDYGTLLLRAGDFEGAYQRLRRADELGARATYETTYLEAALLLGKVDEVLARREALEAAGTHHSLWILSVALAVKGELAAAARAARAAGEDRSAQTEWPLDGLLNYSKAVPGPVGEAIGRFASGYQANLLAGTDEADWKGVFEAFAASLEALAR